VLIALLAIAAFAVVNLFVGALPDRVTKLDTTPNALYTLSGETEHILKTLTRDVNIYVIAKEGNEDPTLMELLSRYGSLSRRVTVALRDPVVSPSFLPRYTNESLYENSMIIECGGRSTIISYYDVYVYYENELTGFYDTYFNAEPLITSAIGYVVSKSLPVVYTLSGHGELGLSSVLAGYIARQNIDVKNLALLSEKRVPEDCECLIIVSPSYDLSDSDREKIMDYLAGGGSLLLYTDYTQEDMPNLSAALGYYGVGLLDGIIIEGDANRYLQGNPHHILPLIGRHEITDVLREANYYILAPVAQAIEITGARDTLEITPLLYTTEKAYIKLLEDYILPTFDFEDGDTVGVFNTGVAIRDIDTGAQIVWYSTSYLLDDETDKYVAGANTDLFINSLGWMCGRNETISIHPKDMSVEYLTVPAGAISFWSAVLVAVLPGGVLLTGGIIWHKRRRRV